MGAHTYTTRLEVRTVPAVLMAGQPATWTLKVFDARSGRPVKDFAVVHDKRMHLIVVSKDLSWFNHLHSDYEGDGIFTLSMVLPRAGVYKLYADYTLEGGGQEVPQHEFTVGGDNGLSDAPSLVADETTDGAWVTRRVDAHAEGQPDSRGGPAYEVGLMLMPGKLVAGQDAMLHFQVRDGKGQPVQDLQPYLGALGHAVILSNDTRTYLHAHPSGGVPEAGEMGGMHGTEHGEMARHVHGGSGGAQMPATEGGPDVTFHTIFPAAGLYKVWGEFRHRGQVMAAPFVLQVTERLF